MVCFKKSCFYDVYEWLLYLLCGRNFHRIRNYFEWSNYVKHALSSIDLDARLSVEELIGLRRPLFVSLVSSFIITPQIFSLRKARTFSADILKEFPLAPIAHLTRTSGGYGRGVYWDKYMQRTFFPEAPFVELLHPYPLRSTDAVEHAKALVDKGENFVVKITNFGTSQNVFVIHDGVCLLTGIDFNTTSFAQEFLREGAASEAFEWIFEKPMRCTQQKIMPIDYKLVMVDGKMAFAFVAINRRKKGAGESTINTSYVTEEYVAIDQQLTTEEGGSCSCTWVKEPPLKPSCWNEMVNIAKEISKKCREFCRVDFYDEDGTPFVGEIQFMIQPNDYTNHASCILEKLDESYGRVWDSHE